jgi:metal-responsive CopG/Arc/MetJ family transcriptional regulator
MTTEQLVVSLSEDLKKRVENFSESNEISQSGAVRMILSNELPEVEG